MVVVRLGAYGYFRKDGNQIACKKLKKETHVTLTILSVSGQRPLYRRRLGRPPVGHRRDRSVAPLTAAPFGQSDQRNKNTFAAVAAVMNNK
jgi:hypothetical protein